jgi:hypothetical protein
MLGGRWRAQASGTPQHQHRDPKQHQHHDPKSDDPQFGPQVHDQILNGKTGEANSENKKARDCARAVASN